MSKLYHKIKTAAGENQNNDIVWVETGLHLSVRTTMTRMDYDNEVYVQYNENNARRQIIDEVYGEYVDELREINAMIWKNEDRDIISQKLNKVIGSMLGGE